MNKSHPHNFYNRKIQLFFWIIYAACFKATVFSQTIGNTVSFYIGPGIASTLSFPESKFDKKYFHSISPYFSWAAELKYRQKLNNYSIISTGVGVSLLKYSFHHTNYYLSLDDEMMYVRRSCMNINVPIEFSYKISSSHNASDIYWTGGCDFEFIHPYGNSSRVTGGTGPGINSDSTLNTFEINASLRTGIEIYRCFHHENFNLFGNFTYQLFPAKPLNISNSSTDFGPNQTFYGELFPGQIAFYFGFIFELGKNID